MVYLSGVSYSKAVFPTSPARGPSPAPAQVAPATAPTSPGVRQAIVTSTPKSSPPIPALPFPVGVGYATYRGTQGNQINILGDRAEVSGRPGWEWANEGVDPPGFFDRTGPQPLVFPSTIESTNDLKLYTTALSQLADATAAQSASVRYFPSMLALKYSSQFLPVDNRKVFKGVRPYNQYGNDNTARKRRGFRRRNKPYAG